MELTFSSQFVHLLTKLIKILILNKQMFILVRYSCSPAHQVCLLDLASVKLKVIP